MYTTKRLQSGGETELNRPLSVSTDTFSIGCEACGRKGLIPVGPHTLPNLAEKASFLNNLFNSDRLRLIETGEKPAAAGHPGQRETDLSRE